MVFVQSAIKSFDGPLRPSRSSLAACILSMPLIGMENAPDLPMIRFPASTSSSDALV